LVLHAYFDGKKCRSCPLRDRCCTRPPSNGNKGSFRLELRPSLIARDFRLAQLCEDSFWERYSIRSGIEATNSELKRAHGIGRLSVRGFPAVRLKVSFKLMACNIKRWLRGVARPSRRPARANRMLSGLWRWLVSRLRPLAHVLLAS
jgi:hypothetical protein